MAAELPGAALTLEEIPRTFNLTSWFLDRQVAEGSGARTALVTAAGATTYAELAALTNRVGHVLSEAGVRAEDRVLLTLSDGIEFVASWYAILKIGAVTAEAYTFLKAKDFAYYLDYTRARVVIADALTLERVREARAQSRWQHTLLVAGVAEHELDDGELSFERMVGEAPDTLEATPTSRDDMAIWKFTTGTTGSPKAAVHSHAAPRLSFDWYGRGVLGLRDDDVVLPVPKLFFGYARDLTTLFPFGVGGRGDRVSRAHDGGRDLRLRRAPPPDDPGDGPDHDAPDARRRGRGRARPQLASVLHLRGGGASASSPRAAG